MLESKLYQSNNRKLCITVCQVLLGNFNHNCSLNPILKHQHRKYRSADIENRIIVTNHNVIWISMLTNPQTTLNSKILYWTSTTLSASYQIFYLPEMAKITCWITSINFSRAMHDKCLGIDKCRGIQFSDSLYLKYRYILWVFYSERVDADQCSNLS